MSYSVAMERRIVRLEQQRARKAASESDNQWYEFLVSPSCPPDKRLYIKGGAVTPSGRWGGTVQDDFIPGWTCDFENEIETQMTLNFTNANYYLGMILCYYGAWAMYRTLGGVYTDPVFDNVIGTEVATATEAEAEVDAFLNGYTQWYYYRLPLWGLIIKNDGQVGVDYAIMPIDTVNRGRSYLYRDARSNGGIFP